MLRPTYFIILSFRFVLVLTQIKNELLLWRKLAMMIGQALRAAVRNSLDKYAIRRLFQIVKRQASSKRTCCCIMLNRVFGSYNILDCSSKT